MLEKMKMVRLNMVITRCSKGDKQDKLDDESSKNNNKIPKKKSKTPRAKFDLQYHI